MNTNLIHIDNNSLKFSRPIEDNYVIYSNLNSFAKRPSVSKLSVKFVLKGTERYTLNGKRYDVNAGEFLLVEPGQDLGIAFESINKVEGICFFIDEKYFNQANDIALGLQINQLDTIESRGTQKYSFLSAKYKSDYSEFGSFLKEISSVITTQPNLTLTEDFFLNFSSSLALHQENVFCQVNKLAALKVSTRKELYRRVVFAKDYIHEHVLDSKLDIKTLALKSNLSEVQLHRCFIQVFGSTPYQYILNLKINKAIKIIEKSSDSLTEICNHLGFADLPTFSKAFKKKQGVSPSVYMKKF